MIGDDAICMPVALLGGKGSVRLLKRRKFAKPMSEKCCIVIL